MLKQQARLFRRLSLVADIMVLFAAFLFAYTLRESFGGGLAPLRNYVWVLLAAVPVWYVLMRRAGLYESLRSLSHFEIFARLVNVHLLGGLLVAAVIFFVDRDQYSRGLYLLFVGLSFLLFLLSKCALRLVLGFLRRRGYNVRHLLIVGTEEKARRLHELIKTHADWGLTIQGFVQAAPLPLKTEVFGHAILGHVADLIAICKKNSPDEVIFCLPRKIFLETDAYVKELEEMGITTRVVFDFCESATTRREIGLFHGELPILTFHSKCFNAQQLLFKRVLDIAGSLVGLGLFSLFFPLLALAIRLDSKGAIFFSQDRVGENGRIFTCWKLRTMVVDAEAQQDVLQCHNQMQGAMFKIKDDPRITRVGKWLRQFSLDEFPQFWNVLKGEMSLVGTRPPTLDEVALYENWHRRRICIKPGITGLWQVNGRSAIHDFDQIVRLDLQYIDHWSLWLDIKLLFKTVWVVLARRGAC
jgi:exopolysaccharide biosynthesis polyprenyl glycosylphosphotransferase